MTSLLAILDLKGQPLIQRTYRDDIPPSSVERFMLLLRDFEEEGQLVMPCFSSEGINYMHIRHENIYFLALSRRNSNAAQVIAFLHQLVSVLIGYFNELEEESIRDNFVVVYELLDEMMDFGYPQTTDREILRTYITQESYKLTRAPPRFIPNYPSYHPLEGIRYKSNEAFLDVTESITLEVNANGNIAHADVFGAIRMRCRLSGTRELRLLFNDKIVLEWMRTGRGEAIWTEVTKLHRCVRLSRDENDLRISVRPPDEEFELLSYRLTTPIKPLIWADATVEHHAGSRIKYTVEVKADFRNTNTAKNVEITIPVPEDVDSPKFTGTTGTVMYAPEQSAFVWVIEQLRGTGELLMHANFGLPSVKSASDKTYEKKRAISVKFEIPNFTVSGLKVRSLKIVDKNGYEATSWVKYRTQSGENYNLRTILERVDRPLVPKEELREVSDASTEAGQR